TQTFPNYGARNDGRLGVCLDPTTHYPSSRTTGAGRIWEKLQSARVLYSRRRMERPPGKLTTRPARICTANEAIAIAAKIPWAGLGSIEVQPIMTFPSLRCRF